MLNGFQRRSSALALLLAASLVVAACQAVAVPSPASVPLPPEVAACQTLDEAPSRPMIPPKTRVVGIDHGADGVMLLTSPVLGDDSLIYLDLCRYTRRAVVGSTDIVGSSLEATIAGALSIDRHLDVVGPPEQGAIAGRTGGRTTAVEVVLADGETVDGVVQDGYWVAWWPGASKVVVVRALDAEGQEVTTLTPPRS